jgi:hypothetical protein
VNETQAEQSGHTEELKKTAPDDSSDYFNSLKNSYKETKPKDDIKLESSEDQEEASPEPKKRRKKNEEPEMENKLLISGYMFLMAVNILLPDLILWLFNRYSKKYKHIEGDQISLDETQIGMLEEIADEVVRIYLPKLNPLLLLLICMGGMYVSNLRKVIKEEKRNKIRI